jgi:hypothetical protein
MADADGVYNRKVIYQAHLTMKVARLPEAQKALNDAIHQAGGFIIQFADSLKAGEIGANYEIKVPSAGFASFLDRLSQIPNERFERQVEGSDVTEEYVDLDARLKAKQTTEARLLSFMEKATRADDLVQFSEQLGKVREEIEQIKGRMRYLEQNVAYSTVDLRLYQGESGSALLNVRTKGLGQRLGEAMTGSVRVLRVTGEGFLVAMSALLPVLAVAAAIGIPACAVARRLRASRRAAAAGRRKRLNANAPSAPDAGGERPEAEGGSSQAEENGGSGDVSASPSEGAAEGPPEASMAESAQASADESKEEDR